MLQEYVRRFAYLVAGGTAMLVTLYACRLINLPPEPGYGGSFFGHRDALFSVRVLMLPLFVLVGLLATIVVGRIHYDSGIACVAAATAVLSFRSGRMQDVLLSANHPNIYLTLIVEVVLLFVPIFSLFEIVRRARALRPLLLGAELDARRPSELVTQKLLCVVMHVTLMAALLVILCQSDDKVQVYVSLLIAGYVASRIAYAFVPTEPSVYFWLPVGLVATIGYGAAYYGVDRSTTSALAIGQTRGMLAALARPLPADYASFGVIGSIAGYWAGRAKRLGAEVESSPATA